MKNIIKNIIIEYLEDFKIVDENIIKIIDEYLKDELTLCKIGNCYVVLDNRLVVLIKKIGSLPEKLIDFYEFNIVSNTNMKMIFFNKEINYNHFDYFILGKFCRLIIKYLFKFYPEEITFYIRNYITKNQENLIKYGLLMNNGWIKPKFNVIDILLNDF